MNSLDELLCGMHAAEVEGKERARLHSLKEKQVEEELFKLSQPVEILLTNALGTVQGIWKSIRGPVLYDVRYADKQGVLHNDWLRHEELDSPAKQ